MLVTVFGIVTDVNELKANNTGGIIEIEEESVNDVKRLLAKALLPKAVTELGIVILVNRLFRKALSPIVVTELGIVILGNKLLKKELVPILVTELGIVILVNELF